jgi:hypothetical protein
MGEKATLTQAEFRTRLATDRNFQGLMDTTSVRQKIEDTPYKAPKLWNSKDAFAKARRG